MNQQIQNNRNTREKENEILSKMKIGIYLNWFGLSLSMNYSNMSIKILFINKCFCTIINHTKKSI